MSFWKKLFGGGVTAVERTRRRKPVSSTEHKGFTIEARPYKESGQFQVAGVIAKGEGEARRSTSSSAPIASRAWRKRRTSRS